MLTFETRKDISEHVQNLISKGFSIGFVPTMGALHEGHISLVNRSVKENDKTIVSIFVNPIQFNNPVDLEKYPRNLDKDIMLLKEAGADIAFVPSVEDMYPDEITETYEFGDLGNVMEGKFRPGHFNGVAIVVERLFKIVKPHKAYFGEKDYQQLMIIKSLVSQINSPVKIIPCPISREEDGLARSSRNIRLKPEMRQAAPFIYQQLLKAREMSGNYPAEELRQEIEKSFAAHPLLSLEYIEIADGDSLKPITGAITDNSYAFIAVNAGDIRLIDNIRLI